MLCEQQCWNQVGKVAIVIQPASDHRRRVKKQIKASSNVEQSQQEKHQNDMNKDSLKRNRDH